MYREIFTSIAGWANFTLLSLFGKENSNSVRADPSASSGVNARLPSVALAKDGSKHTNVFDVLLTERAFLAVKVEA